MTPPYAHATCMDITFMDEKYDDIVESREARHATRSAACHCMPCRTLAQCGTSLASLSPWTSSHFSSV